MDGHSTSAPDDDTDGTDAGHPGHCVLQLGDVRIDVRNLRVERPDAVTRLTPRSLAVLMELVAGGTQLVSRSDILDRVWPDSFPTPDALSQAIRELRRALGDDARKPRIIETVHGVGYRLKVAAVACNADHRPAVASSLAQTPGAAGVAPSTDIVAAHPLHRGIPGRLRPVIAAAAMLAVAAGAFAAFSGAGDTPAQMPSPQVSLVTSDPGAEKYPALSPDAALLAYAWRPDVTTRWDLAVRAGAAGRPLPLTSTVEADELLPAWSPDGRSIAYVRIESGQCTIERIAATGGASRRLAACDAIATGSLAWDRSGQSIVAALPSAQASGEPRLHRIPAEGGAPTPITARPSGAGWELDPAVSPDGRWIAFRAGVPPDFDVHVVAAEGGEARRLTHHGRIGEGLAWNPDGRSLLVSHMFGGDPCLQRLELSGGEGVPLGILSALRPYPAGDQLSFQRQRLRVQMVSLSLDDEPGELPLPVAASTGSVRLFAAAPAGGRVAYLSDRGGTEQLWVESADGDTEVYPHPPHLRITSFDWSDDGDSLLAIWSGSGVDDALVVLELATGNYRSTGLQRPLLREVVHGESEDAVYAIARDGARAVVTRFERKGDGSWSQQHSGLHAVDLLRVPGQAGVHAFTPANSGKVLQVGADLGSRELAVQSQLLSWAADAAGRIWYLRAVDAHTAELRVMEPASGNERAVRRLDYPLAQRRPGLGISDGRVVVALLVEDSTDIGSVALH